MDYSVKWKFLIFVCLQMFCESQAPGTDMSSVLYNSVRIPGALSNIVEFSEAFNCPNGCRMNPIKKCTL